MGRNRLHSISKLKAVLLVCLIVVATTAVGYYYYVQTRVSSPSSQVPVPSSSPTSSPTASSPSPSPSASPTSQPTATSSPTPTPVPTPTPTPAPGYYLSALSITPIEPWPGDSITITAQLTNNEINGNTSVSLNINGQPVSTQTGIQISSGTSEPITFTTTETATGTYSVQLDTLTGSSLTGSFTVAPNGYYTLSISTSYSGSIPFTLDGASETAPYSSLVTVGDHTIVMPTAVGALDAYTFRSWADDGSTNPRTIDVEGPTSLTADYNGPSGSCPSLYMWNGTGYSYVAEVNDGTGWLGYVDYYQPDGTAVYGYNYPYDYIKLDLTQLQSLNGFYNMKLTQMSDEIFYLDSVQMIAVDHPANVNVFSTASTMIYNLTGQGTIYTVSTNLATPVSAVNGTGQNVLPLISKLDGKFTTGTMWAWNSLTLNLGNLNGAKQINMVVAAKTVWPTEQAGGENFLSYANQPGVTPQPPPYMQVKAANGSWVNVPDDREFPIPHTTDSEFVVNLTGLFPTNNYELKINTWADIQFDYIGISTTPQQNIIVHTITPSSANLEQAFSTNSNSSGAFTKYGDVTALLQSADNQFVIGRQGDSVSLQFSAADLPPVPKGWVRDYFIITSCWFKGEGLSYVPFTVNPLPFQGMTSFPYPSNESYPYDAVHLAYLLKYNTRSIEAQTPDPPTQSAHDKYNQIKELELLAAYAALATLLASAVIILAYRRRKRANRVIN